MFQPQHSRAVLRAGPRSGFALVLALGLMAFVLLLLLTMSTLVRVSVKSAATQKELTLARQNALLGVQVALGQLQKEMGPDQRISATASLLDTDPDTEVIEGVGQPYWTGVWESLDWDRASQLNTPVSSLANASDGKPASFRGWLVSGFANPALTADQKITLARNFTSASNDAVEMLGEGTLGTAALAQTQSVYVKRESINASETSLEENGYAYWVGDEGVKARFGNPVVEEPTTNEEKLYAVSTLRRPNLQALDGWADYVGVDDSVGKVFNYGGLKAAAEENLNESTAFDGKYHAVSPFSSGILTDVRFGGLKKDISLLFGGNNLPSEYRDEPMFEIGSVEGPEWEYLKRYHNRYQIMKSESDGTAYFNILDVKPEAETPVGSAIKKAGDTPMPVVVRIQYLFSLYKGYNTINGLPVSQLPAGTPQGDQSDEQIVYLMVTPVIYLWNPYNVAIRMPRDRQAALNLLPGYLQLQLSLDDGSSYLPLDQMFWVNAGELFSMNTSNVNEGAEFYIPPGEMVINSLKKLEYGQMMCVYYADREDFFGEDADNINGDPYQFSRIQDMAEGFDEGSMGFFTFKMKERTPGGDVSTMKLPATGSAKIRLRFNPNQAKFIFKTSIGGEYADRNPAGVVNMDSINPISANLTPVEYVHEDAVPLASLPAMLQGNQFSGLAPLFALNYDIRGFEETTTAEDPRIGKPGFFTDPTNPYYYYEEADEKAFAMAPFRFWFEPVSENPVQVDIDTGRPAYRTKNGDLVYSNVAKELPVAPMVSIAQMEHAPVGRDYQHHAYQFSNLGWSNAMEDLTPGSSQRRNMAPEFNRPIGNSMGHPLIASNQIWDGAFGVDRSYFLNDLLFDDFYLSGIAEQEGPFFEVDRSANEILDDIIDGELDFDNSNYRFVIPESVSVSDVKDLLLPSSSNPGIDPFDVLAAFIAVEGSFNINSASVDAWAAMISSLRGQAIVYENLNPLDTGYRDDANAELTPFLPQTVPAGPASESLSDPVLANAALWSGYRALSDEQIRRLAAKLVAQVKARGPFLSLAQFINREVSTRSPYNQMGALQSAINESDLNTRSDDGSFESILESRFDSNAMPLDDSGLDAAGFAFPEVMQGDLNDGGTGYLTQGHLLKPIAPVLSPRSDTFVIRSYGDVVVNGSTVAKVWCEVVAQRRVDYIEDVGADLRPWDIPVDGELGQLFGREFKILSFRWLSPSEV